MNDREHFTHAIAAHATWKSRLKQAIETGKSDWAVESVRPDGLCEFGKWLYACSSAETATERWRKIRELHAEFHREAARILTLALTGRTADAQAAYALGSHFSKTSADLTLALVAWRDALGSR
jgi:hypothetical protein